MKTFLKMLATAICLSVLVSGCGLSTLHVKGEADITTEQTDENDKEKEEK